MARLESAWLADKSTAPEEELCTALLSQMTITAETVGDILHGRNARFLAALLLRGVSRLWTAGPDHPLQS